MKGNFRFKRAAHIKVPDQFFKPLATGIREVDASFSEVGGIIPSQVTFITGNPGAGKTTLTLAIGAQLSTNVPVAFISLEMSDFQLANQARKIAGFGAVHVTGDFDPEGTLEALAEIKPGLIILDSIQKAARKVRDENGKPVPFDRAQFMIVDIFTRYAKENWVPVLLIGHCDKAGNYKGPSDLLHDVDSHLLVSYDKDNDLRTFGFGKNRFGGEMGENLFGITRDNVWIGSPYVVRAFPGARVEANEPHPLEQALGNLRGSWGTAQVRGLISTALEELRTMDTELAGKVDTTRVKHRYRGKSLANCDHRKGVITFGEKVNRELVIGQVGYGKEQRHIRAHVRDSADLLLWVVVHEWCHLYPGMQHHKNEFFELVARKWVELNERMK